MIPLFLSVRAGNQECLQLAMKNRCHNLIEKTLGSGATRRKNFARRCEINFLPVVHFEDEEPPFENRLECVEYVEGKAKKIIDSPLFGN